MVSKHSKILFSILFLLISGKTFSQNDSLVDVFPLAIGNSWVYNYYTFFWTDEVWESDGGTANYYVVGKTMYSDSTVWFVKEHRELLHHIHEVFPPSFDTTYPIIDSTTFTLIEFHQLNRPIFRTEKLSNVSLSVFPFGRDVNDSGVVYRYRQVSLGDTISFQARDTNLYYQNSVDLTFKKSIGTIRVHCQNSPYVVGVGWESKHRLISSIINDVRNTNSSSFPLQFYLSQNHPNPFNPVTSLEFQVPSSSFVKLKVYDILGNEVATLVNEQKEAGNYSVQWNAETFPSGMYFYRLNVTQQGLLRYVETKRLLLMK